MKTRRHERVVIDDRMVRANQALGQGSFLPAEEGDEKSNATPPLERMASVLGVKRKPAPTLDHQQDQGYKCLGFG